MILKHGDQVHLALPLGKTREMRDDIKDTLARLYATFGVNLAVISEHEGLHAPRIVAVFRSE